MQKLPNRNLALLAFVFLFFVSNLAVPVKSLAASAYFSPQQGIIQVKNFSISVFVESTTTEPKIASTQLKISYPANVKVVSIEQGQFDSYIEKADNPTTRQISFNAVNNAGNYKSGQVKVALIKFETTDNTGQVQLAIQSDSEISGEGGEQLLTETINGTYSLDIKQENPVGAVTTTTVPAETTTVEKPAVPETGVSNIFVYLAMSFGLVILGIVSYANPFRLTREG